MALTTEKNTRYSPVYELIKLNLNDVKIAVWSLVVLFQEDISAHLL